MRRRDFVKKGLLASSALCFPHIWIKNSRADSNIVKVSILQTNDTHSRIDPFPMDGGKNQGLGGISRRAALVKRIRQQNQNVLLLDGGDVLQGTPYFNEYKGRLEYETMTACGYNASTLGNHEFDNGIEPLANALSYAKFDILNCNYDFGKSVLRPFIKTFITRQVGAMKVGITGVGIDFVDLVTEKHHQGITCHHPYKPLQSVVSYLRKDQKCLLVVVLSHLGYKYEGERPSDVQMAYAVDGIDWIVGGHTHTFMNEPEIVVSKHGHTARILQVGWGGMILGKSDFLFEGPKLMAVFTDCIKLDSTVAENQLKENVVG